MSDLIISDYWCCLLLRLLSMISCTILHCWLISSTNTSNLPTTPYTLTYTEMLKWKKNIILAFEFFSTNTINYFHTHSTNTKCTWIVTCFFRSLYDRSNWAIGLNKIWIHKKIREKRDIKKQKTITKTNSYQLFAI